MASVTPLHQTYQTARTLATHESVKQRYEALQKHARDHGLVRRDGRLYGRLYDYAVLFELAGDLTGKSVGEFGARDGFFGSYATRDASSVYVSDYFEEWGKGTDSCLGQFDMWKALWEQGSFAPEKLTSGTEDLMGLSPADASYDITACISVIEHVFTQGPEDRDGDVRAMRELVRVTKPGGLLLISTDMLHPDGLDRLPEGAQRVGEDSAWYSGTLWYGPKDLRTRIVESDGVELLGGKNAPHCFDPAHPDNDDVHPLPHCDAKQGPFATPVVFALRRLS